MDPDYIFEYFFPELSIVDAPKLKVDAKETLGKLKKLALSFPIILRLRWEK